MIKTDGYFLLHRSIFENPVVTKDSDYFITWIYILSQAEWKSGKKVDFGGKIIELQAGQFTTGISGQMLNDLKKVNNGLNISKLNRVLKKLKSEKQIEQRTDYQCSLITVLNWEKYQISEQRNEQRANNERTTSEQRVNTNELKEEYKERNKGINNNPLLSPLVKNQEENKKSNSLSKKEIQIEINNIIDESELSQEVKDKLKEFVEYRRKSKFKFFTNPEYFKSGNLKDTIKCEKDYGSYAAIRCIENTLAQGYQGVFFDNAWKYDKEKQRKESFDADEFLRRFDE